ncbi:MAG: hypothetical protein QHH27_08160 [Clostridia bacterium]|nr:hypothetical protein [Clostridia bacterium]MDH7573503.1 hypothetical protein [Clostridia bacterium]
MKPRLARLTEVLAVERENLLLGTVYLAVLVFVLALYLWVGIGREEGYNPVQYRNAYVYFLVFDFLLFTLFVPYWEREAASSQNRYLWKSCVGIAVMAASTVPVALAIFVAGRTMPADLLLPLALKTVWGMAVVVGRGFLEAVKPGWRWNGFLTGFLIFCVLVLGGLLAYFCVQYRQAVITTLYDRDIPKVFFLNPLLALAGLAYCQAGGGTQLGLLPAYACLGFWGLVTAALVLATQKVSGGRLTRG